jgi:hypothetical protein
MNSEAREVYEWPIRAFVNLHRNAQFIEPESLACRHLEMLSPVSSNGKRCAGGRARRAVASARWTRAACSP